MTDLAGRVMRSGEVARLLGISGSKINALADSGMLKCFRIPNARNISGHRHRRFVIDDVLRFAKENGIPLSSTDYECDYTGR